MLGAQVDAMRRGSFGVGSPGREGSALLVLLDDRWFLYGPPRRPGHSRFCRVVEAAAACRATRSEVLAASMTSRARVR